MIQRIIKMKYLNNQWIFLAIMAYIVQNFWLTLHWGWGLLGVAFFIRCLFLTKIVKQFVFIVIVISSVVTFRTRTQPLVSQEENTYLLQIDPIYLNGDEEYITGRAKLWSQGEWLTINVKGSQLSTLHQLDQVTLLEVKGRITIPEGTRNFGGFNYQKYLQSQNIDYQIEIKTIERAQSVNNFFGYFLNWRWRLLNHFQKLDHIRLFSLYNRLIWNLSSTQYKTHRERLIEFGIIHFFAISGFHVTLIKNNIDYLLRRFSIINEVGSLIIDGLLIGYTFLTCFPVGVVRSVGSHFLKKYGSLSRMDNLSLLVLAFLWFNPRIVLSTGFQLSFLISYILIFIEKIPKPLPFSQSIQLAIICTLFTWPITMRQNYYWYPLQLIWGLIIGKVFDWGIFPLAVLLTLLSFSPKGQLLVQHFDFLLEPIELFQPKILVGHYSWVLVIVLMAVAGRWLVDWQQAWKFTIISYIGLILISGRCHFERIIVLDVGQGDAVLYQAAFSNQGWLIDVGGKVSWNRDANSSQDQPEENYAKKTILSALAALGVRQLEGIVITHPDADHFANLPAIIKTIPVKEIVISNIGFHHQNWQQVMGPYQNQLPLTILEAPGWQTIIPDTLWGWFDTNAPREDLNESSIVTLLKLSNRSFLNMGDLGKIGEQKLLTTIPNLDINLLKVGHHGSNTSTSKQLIEQTTPEMALISVGKNNRYGHPHQEVTVLLQQEQIPYLSTADNGAIEMMVIPFKGINIRHALSP